MLWLCPHSSDHCYGDQLLRWGIKIFMARPLFSCRRLEDHQVQYTYHNLLATFCRTKLFYASYMFVFEGQLLFEAPLRLYHEASSIYVRESSPCKALYFHFAFRRCFILKKRNTTSFPSPDARLLFCDCIKHRLFLEWVCPAKTDTRAQ